MTRKSRQRRQKRPQCNDADNKADARSDSGEEPSEGDGDRELQGSRAPLVLENLQFEAYYRRQCICPEQEWDSFLLALRTGLPTAVRVNPCANVAGQVLAELRKLNECLPQGSIAAPRPLPWYPGGLAWQWDGFGSHDVHKKQPQLKSYLGWLQSIGALFRQEAVSMIPPLCLGVQPGHRVLDMCAAPGSKASQLLELLHWDGSPPGVSNTQSGTGLLVANEIHARRIDTLMHVLQRFRSPCTVVTHLDAQYIPDFVDADGHAFRFDRVLADVPCSGDGALRKFPSVWGTWSPSSGLNMNPMQYAILCRGLNQLRVGGRLVYSTCSLNPVEDEAVVAAAVRKFQGDVALVPLPPLEGLDGSPGLQTWVVPHPDDASTVWTSFDDVPHELRSRSLHPNVFPPILGSAEALEWSRCCHNCRRFLPHTVHSGGFFVAVFERLRDRSPEGSAGDFQDQTSAETASCQEATSVSTVPGKTRRKGNKEPKYISDYELVSPDDASARAVAEIFGLDVTSLGRLVRKQGCEKRLYGVTEEVLQFLNSRALIRPRILHVGVRLFERMPPSWRLVQDGVAIILERGLQRCIAVNKSFMFRLLSENDIPVEELLSAETTGEVQGLQKLVLSDPESVSAVGDESSQNHEQVAARLWSGSLIVTLSHPDRACSQELLVAITALLSRTCLRAYVPKLEAAALLQCFELGERTEEILAQCHD